MLLTGAFPRNLDEKCRFSLPKSLRDTLRQAGLNTLFLTLGADSSLALHTEPGLLQMGDLLDRHSPAGQDARDFSRLFYTHAQRVELDRQGRVRLPTDLAQLAGLRREIVLLGVRDHMEIWDRARWQEFLSKSQPKYDEIADRAFGQTRENPPSVRSAPTNAIRPR